MHRKGESRLELLGAARSRAYHEPIEGIRIDHDGRLQRIDGGDLL